VAVRVTDWPAATGDGAATRATVAVPCAEILATKPVLLKLPQPDAMSLAACWKEPGVTIAPAHGVLIATYMLPAGSTAKPPGFIPPNSVEKSSLEPVGSSSETKTGEPV